MLQSAGLAAILGEAPSVGRQGVASTAAVAAADWLDEIGVVEMAEMAERRLRPEFVEVMAGKNALFVTNSGKVRTLDQGLKQVAAVLVAEAES